MSLYEIATSQEEILHLITDRDLNNQQVADRLGDMGIGTSRRSVCRARQKLGMVSPLSEKAKLNLLDAVETAPEKPSLLTRLKGLFRIGRS